MTTLWILFLGFRNATGGVTPFTGQQTLQPLATYRTVQECSDSGQSIFTLMQGRVIVVQMICLPTGVSDPVARAPVTQQKEPEQATLQELAKQELARRAAAHSGTASSAP
jgi:hypothetical protein